MKTRSIRLAALLAGILAGGALALPAPAAQDAAPPATWQEAQRAGERYYARVAAELAATGRPRDLAFAAVLLDTAAAPDDPRIDAWRQRASTRAGDDVIANALLAQPEPGADADIRDHALRRWQQAEPDNLAPRLLGTEPVESWLPAAGDYARVDLRFHGRLRWMQAALQAHPPREAEQALLGDSGVPPEQFATALASAILAGRALPPLEPLSRACSGESLQATVGRREDCRDLARLLVATADVQVLGALGASLLGRTAADEDDAAEAAALRRRGAWQAWQWAWIAGARADRGLGQTATLLADPAIAREQDLVARVLADAGVPPDPPADWEPPPPRPAAED